MKKLNHPFHLVTLSPWPMLTSFSLMILFINFIYMLNFSNFNNMFFSILILILCLFQWWRDVIRESTIQGFHTNKVLSGLKLGMLLFIISELFFFISIFWCYFHMFLSPSIDIGVIWPPKNICTFNPYLIPLINTLILLSSGVSITLSHHSLINKNKYMMIMSMMITIFLGILFSMLQYMEYLEASFNISDSIYGSVFFMGTGFHGLHVIIGSIFLLINLIRMINNDFSSIHHFSFEAAAWYWHFVDVIWLFLYLLFYFWSN